LLNEYIIPLEGLCVVSMTKFSIIHIVSIFRLQLMENQKSLISLIQQEVVT
jgi:hypothetical protein